MVQRVIFLGVFAARKRILLYKIRYATVQHSLSESFIVMCQGAEPRRVPNLPAGPRLVRLRLLHLEDRRGPSFPRGAQDAGERRAAVPAHGHVRGAARLRARGHGRLRGALLGPDQRHPAGARVPR